eukprot:1727336-Heterocapsa_arctica.AAC.1
MICYVAAELERLVIVQLVTASRCHHCATASTSSSRCTRLVDQPWRQRPRALSGSCGDPG